MQNNNKQSLKFIRTSANNIPSLFFIIASRNNTKLYRLHMPLRYWNYLTEKL